MSKSTFKILFYLRKNQVNKDGTVCIMIRLSLNGEITQFSSKLSVKPDAWDTVLGKAKGNTQKARQLNETLEDIRASLKNHYRDIEVHESFVTVEKIRNAFLGITAKQRTLLELFKKHNEDARKLVGISKTPATLAKYDRCYRRLEEFMKVKYNISDISLKEIGHIADLKSHTHLFVRKALSFVRKMQKHVLSNRPQVPPLSTAIHSECEKKEDERNTPTMRWTGSMAELVELIYGLDAMKLVNEGETGIKELLEGFCKVFGMEIKESQCYNTYADIKRRKNDSRTYFFDKAAEKLNRRMQEDEERERIRKR